MRIGDVTDLNFHLYNKGDYHILFEMSSAAFVPIAVLRYGEIPVGKLLRTIGELQEHNIQKQQLVIKDADSDSTLVIDCSLIEPFPFRQRIIYQFIGEVRVGSDSQLILRAYVYRCVEGLNLDMYKKVHELRSRSLLAL